MRCCIFRSPEGLAVRIPGDILSALNLEEGSLVDLDLDSSQKTLKIFPSTQGEEDRINQKFPKQVEEVLDQFGPVLERMGTK